MSEISPKVYFIPYHMSESFLKTKRELEEFVARKNNPRVATRARDRLDVLFERARPTLDAIEYARRTRWHP